MQNDTPQPLHPRTVEAMRLSDGKGYMQIIHNADQAAADIIRVIRGWPPEKLAELLKIFEGLYDGADADNHDQKALAGLALIKLGELLAVLHGEVRDGLHDKEKEDDAGGDAE